jgi:hypothetical protein
VRDRAGCLSLGVLRQSSLQLAQLAHTQGVEVLVETSTTGPAEPDKVLQRMGPRAVYVAIDTKAPDVKVRLSEQLKKEGFDAEPLRKQLLTACRDHQFDMGLVEGIKLIRTGATRER